MKYPSVNQMIEGHAKGMQRVHEFLAEHGADHWHDKFRFTNGITMRVRHVAEEDPDNTMYYVWTEEEYQFKVPFDKLQHMIETLKDHQGIGKNRIGSNIVIQTSVTNQFAMHKRLSLTDYDGVEHVTLKLEFRIYHNIPKDEIFIGMVSL
jgi:hypothetical protein